MAEFDVFASIIEAFGEPVHARRLAQADVGVFHGRVPDPLLAFLHDHGTGSWRDGAFTLCHPALLAPVVDAVFRGDPDLDPAVITAIGYGPFGDLTCWHPSGNMLYVHFLDGSVFQAIHDPGRPTRPELAGLPRPTPGFAVGLAVMNGIESTDDPPYDDTGASLFPQAVARLGPLEPGEVFGFAPAGRFGGAMRLEDVTRTDVAGHLLFLSQVTTLRLEHLGPATPDQPFGVLARIRNVGAPGR